MHRPPSSTSAANPKTSNIYFANVHCRFHCSFIDASIPQLFVTQLHIMRSVFALAFSILQAALFVQAGFSIPKVPDPVPAPLPAPLPEVPVVGSGRSSGSSGDSSDPYSGGSSGGTSEPLGPLRIGSSAPDSGSQPAGSNGEKSNIGDVIDKIQSVLDAITSVVELSNGSPTTTSAASLPTAAYPCSSAQVVYDACAARTSNFSTMELTMQADCLCYDISTIRPFDGYMSSCNNFVQNQTRYAGTTASAIQNATSLCAQAQSVSTALLAAASTAAPQMTAASTPTTPPSTGTASRLPTSHTLFLCLGFVLGISMI